LDAINRIAIRDDAVASGEFDLTRTFIGLFTDICEHGGNAVRQNKLAKIIQVCGPPIERLRSLTRRREVSMKTVAGPLCSLVYAYSAPEP